MHNKLITHVIVVQQENERIKRSQDAEEKLMVTAWYNLVRCCTQSVLL